MCKRNYARRLKSQGFTNAKIAELCQISTRQVSQLLSVSKPRCTQSEDIRKAALRLAQDGFDRSVIVANFGEVI